MISLLPFPATKSSMALFSEASVHFDQTLDENLSVEVNHKVVEAFFVPLNVTDTFNIEFSWLKFSKCHG